MSDKTIPPVRGGSIYEVLCLRKGANARTATEADFFTVRVRAPNTISARLIARNERDDCANAFEAKAVQSELRADVKNWIAIIGDKRIPTSAKVVEHYERAFRKTPVRFEPVDPEAPRDENGG